MAECQLLTTGYKTIRKRLVNAMNTCHIYKCIVSLVSTKESKATMLERAQQYEKAKGADVLWTIKDLERIFQVSERTIIRYYREYDLKVVTLPGNLIRFTPESVREFIQAHEGMWNKAGSPV